MTANTSFKSVIANASTEGYAITLEESAKALVYDPESFMPAAVDDLALAPGHALLQVAQAVEVVKHALSFPTIDAYLERSLAIMEEKSGFLDSRLFIGNDPITRHQYMFHRHLGLAIVLEHEELDEILDGIERAMLRGDDALKLTETVRGDGEKFYHLDKFLGQFLTARNLWERPQLEANLIGIYRPDGSVRSLKLMGLLFEPQLNAMIKLEIAAGSAKLVRAIHDLKNVNGYFPDYVAPKIKNILSLLAANMEIPAIKALRQQAGVNPVPDRLETVIRLERYFQFLTCGEVTQEELTLYVISGNHDLEDILYGVLQFSIMDELTFANDLQRAESVRDFAKAMRTVMLRDERQLLRITQRALASFFEKGSPEYLEMIRTDDSKILEAVAQRFTPEQCADHPALLAVCGSRPVKEYEDWCQGFDERGLVAEALYKITDDQAYKMTVHNLNTRARMFTGELGI